MATMDRLAKPSNPRPRRYLLAKAVIWSEAILLFAVLGLCIVALHESSIALRDFLDECADPYFASEGLVELDADVTAQKKRAMHLLHGGIVQLASKIPDAAPVVGVFGWLVEYQVGSALNQAHLAALQALMPLATMVERLTMEVLRTMRTYMEALCIAALLISFLALCTLVLHAILSARWREYFRAVLGVNRTVIGAGVSIPAKRIIKLSLKVLTTASCLLTLSMTIISHYVIPTVAEMSFIFSCMPGTTLERAAFAALALTLVAQMLVFVENATWRYGRIKWINDNCSTNV